MDIPIGKAKNLKDLLEQEVKLSCYDEDIGINDLVGEVKIKMSELLSPIDKVEELRKRKLTLLYRNKMSAVISLESKLKLVKSHI